MAKKIKNPDGKKGGEKHRNKIKEVAEDAEKRGLLIQFEFFVEVLKGIKNRFVDIAAFNRKTLKLEELHQVGVCNKNGTPVKRERDAIEDIERNSHLKVKFHAYNLSIVTILFAVFLIIYFL
jgi:U3 small nucleolar ribonucleoprotein component